MDKLAAAAHETDKPDARLSAGDHCRFCPAAGRCPELTRYVTEAAQHEFDPATRAVRLDSEQFADMLRKVPIVSAWASAVSAEAFRHLQSGGAVVGHKLVHGRSNRFWVNAQAARKALLDGGISEDEVAPRKFVSPAQAEELYKERKRTKEFKAVLAPLIDKVPGSLTLVPDTDPRPAQNPSAQFDDESLLS
jgi:hypothetical protein